MKEKLNKKSESVNVGRRAGIDDILEEELAIAYVTSVDDLKLANI